MPISVARRQILACWALCLLMASAVDASRRAAQPAPLSRWFSGTASFFGGPVDSRSINHFKLTIDSGSCGYGDIDPRLWPFYNVVGLHPSNAIVLSRPEAACGSCLEVECHDDRNCYPMSRPLKTIITDQCDEFCNATNVNMHVFAFEQLAPIRVGRVGIRYRLVECDPADSIVIHISDYRAAEGGWLRMAFRNLAGDAGLRAVELAASTSSLQVTNSSQHSWAALTNTFGANWELSGLPAPPLLIRLTNTIGQKVIIRHAIAIAGATGDIETSAQFPLAAATAAATTNRNTPSSNATLASTQPSPALVLSALPAASSANTNINAVVDVGQAVPRSSLPNVAADLPVNASNTANTTDKPIGRRMLFFRH